MLQFLSEKCSNYNRLPFYTKLMSSYLDVFFYTMASLKSFPGKEIKNFYMKLFIWKHLPQNKPDAFIPSHISWRKGNRKLPFLHTVCECSVTVSNTYCFYLRQCLVSIPTWHIQRKTLDSKISRIINLWYSWVF